MVSVVAGHAMLMPEPLDYAAALRGLGAEIREGEDAQDYVNRELVAWRE
ncbi:MAG TPA: hypothetical protein VFD32_10945 [Dehalococcoidia bacterium]|nr:hypothetical protein [Dehalococcoidia bacterium]